MGIINDPTPGQPIDVNYISQIVKAVNGLNDDYVTKDKQSRIAKAKKGSKTTYDVTRTSNLALVAGYTEVSSDTKTNTKDVKEVTFAFNRTFSNPPIVVATPEIATSGITKTTSGVTVLITNVTKSTVKMSVLFDSTAKKTTIGINILAIGIPSAVG
jgi:hypothetical protein